MRIGRNAGGERSGASSNVKEEPEPIDRIIASHFHSLRMAYLRRADDRLIRGRSMPSFANARFDHLGAFASIETPLKEAWSAVSSGGSQRTLERPQANAVVRFR